MKFIQENALAIEFIDSNIWLYAIADGQDAHKEGIARKITKSKQIAISVQVINEVCLNLIKKYKFDETEIQKLVRSFFGKHRVIEIDKDVLLRASNLRGKYHFSYWDSLIVAAALVANATILYSEDTHNGLLVENKLRIINPF